MARGTCPICGDTVEDVETHLHKALGSKEKKKGMTIAQLIQQLRHLVLEHPHASECEVVLHPHGTGHRQHISNIHFNHHETKVVLEAER